MPLVFDEHPGRSLDRFEARGGQAEAWSVPQVRDQGAVGTHQPEGRMPVVAVLGVLEADQGAVEADVGDVRVLGGGVDAFRRVRLRVESPDLGSVVVAATDVGGAVAPQPV